MNNYTSKKYIKSRTDKTRVAWEDLSIGRQNEILMDRIRKREKVYKDFYRDFNKEGLKNKNVEDIRKNIKNIKAEKDITQKNRLLKQYEKELQTEDEFIRKTKQAMKKIKKNFDKKYGDGYYKGMSSWSLMEIVKSEAYRRLRHYYDSNTVIDIIRNASGNEENLLYRFSVLQNATLEYGIDYHSTFVIDFLKGFISENEFKNILDRITTDQNAYIEFLNYEEATRDQFIRNWGKII